MRNRTPRLPNHEKLNHALIALATALSGSERNVLQLLVESVLALTNCDSGGLSLLTSDDGTIRFSWPAIAGAWKQQQTGNGVARDATPCGDVLDRNCALLFRRFDRRYPAFRGFAPPPEECLIVPFSVGGRAIGTLWAIFHSDRRKFDGADERVMCALGEFASIACKTIPSKHEIETRYVAVPEAAQSIERSLRTIINTIPVLAWSARPDGSADFFNKYYLEYCGFSSEQAQGTGWMKAVHPDDLPGLAKYWQAVMPIGKPGEYEARLRRFDGAYRWFLFRAQPFRDESGEIVKWYGTNTDIEDRKSAEEALRASEWSLRESEESLRLMFNTIPALVCRLKADWSVDEVNPQVLEYFGKTLDELRDWAFIGVVHPDDLEAVIARCRHSTETGEPYDVEHRCRRRDGIFRWFHVRGRPLRNAAGEIVRWYVVLIDIENRRRAEETLRSSEFNLRQLTETIPAMLWSANKDGAVDYCNKRYLRYTGFPAEEVTGDGWRQSIHPEDSARVDPIWQSCIRTGAPYQVEVRTWRAEDLTYRWCLVTALPLLDQQGRILNWHGTILDVHDWKEAQQQLRNTQAELAHLTRVMTMGELAASIAHEVNQPLTAAVASSDSCASWLADTPPNVEKARAAADRVAQAITQASAVIQRIRTMFGKAGVVTAPLSVNDVIADVISLIQDELSSKGISLRTELSEGLPLVSGDRVQLAQVVLNLATNGIEAMKESAAGVPCLLIQSGWAANATEVQVSLTDTGPGLDLNALPRVFDAFFTTKPGGMGMGLPISKSIIENHGGRLWASENKPRGSVFTFALPTTANR